MRRERTITKHADVVAAAAAAKSILQVVLSSSAASQRGAVMSANLTLHY